MSIKFKIHIKKNITKLVVLIALIINMIILVLINGSLWGFFCFTFLFLTLTLFLSFRIYKKLNQKYFSGLFKKESKITKFTKLFIVMLCVLFITYGVYPVYMIGMSHIRSEANKSELQDVVNSIISPNMSDEEKTLALLEWFDEDKGNIFNQYHLYQKKTLGIPVYPMSHIVLYFSEPYFAVRSFLDNDAPWIYSSQYGHCGEYGLLFRYMAEIAGLKVRKINCLGEDHVWNEVKINGSWVIIDATCHHPQIKGYNKSSRFMEKKVGEDIKGITYGNVSYVIAEYLNGTREDVTQRYTLNRTNISIQIVDSAGIPIENMNVKLYSSNRVQLRYTGLYNITNKEGKCVFTVGGGSYTFKAEDVWFSPIYGKVSGSYSENQSYHEDKITMGFDWFKIIVFVGISVLILFLILRKQMRWKKMIKINYEKISKLGILGGVIVIILSIFSLIMIWMIRGYIIMSDYIILAAPMSLGVGVLSIGIAFLSCNIAEKTDIKIKNLMKAFFMDITYEFEQIKNQIKKGRKIRLSVNLSDSGFGYSQLLPIIIQGLYTPPKDMIIYEQPEIHLNPSYQSKLGDFFVHLANNEKKFILLETHSEHILLRIRTLIAENKINNLDVALYFIERKDESSIVTPIPIHKNGFIADEDWPEGFFDDTITESFRLTSAQREWNKKNVNNK